MNSSLPTHGQQRLSKTAVQSPLARWKRRFFSGRFLYISVLLHVGLVIFATYLVMRTIQPRKLTFQAAPPSPNPSSHSLEHRVQIAKKTKSMSAPMPAKRIATSGMAKVVLPDMPVMPAPTDFEPSQMAAMAPGRAAMLGGAPSQMPAVGGGAAITFFGLRAKSKSVVFIIDITGSMIIGKKNIQTWRKLEREVEKVLNGLGPETRFNLIVFGPEAHSYKPSLMLATDSTKKEAFAFLKSWSPALALKPGETPTLDTFSHGLGLRNRGTIPSKAFEAAFKNRPETILFLSDGDPNENKAGIFSLLKKLEASRPRPVPISVIAYYADNGQEFMKAVAKQSGGEYRELK